MALAPLGRLLILGWQSYRGSGVGLGANPIEKLTHRTGSWALYLLLATLAITPLRRLLGAGWLVRVRRLVGLLAFFYASLHLATYVFDRAYVELAFDLPGLARDLAKRPFISVGTLAYLLLVPLALTSSNRMIRRLGRRWQTLHRLTYAAALLAIVHFTWLVKSDLRRPLALGLLLLGLLAVRFGSWAQALHQRQDEDRK
jgi:sulfoxide reductase heme-binding subunit YedZ